jgi:tetratricopeptide (TPR) repeat protein
MLPYTHIMATFDSSTTIAQAKKLLSQSKVSKAQNLLKLAMKSTPDDFQITYMYAQLLGDISLTKSGVQQRRMKGQAVALLKQLSRKLRNRSAEERWKVLRHLYYFSSQDLKNYRLGILEVSRGNKLGHLSQGIGAGCHALALFKKGNIKSAKAWALKSELAFVALFEVDKRLPNRLCHYARALSIQGKYTESAQCIKEAIKTSGEPRISFLNIIKELEEIKNLSCRF